MMSGFVHLHVHSVYSFVDGAARIDDLVETAKNMGMKSLAITDHGAMYGAAEFYRAAIQRGIKPIIGCEFYVVHSSRYIKDRTNKEEYFHLVLLAENDEGYKNLVRLVSRANTEGKYSRPRIDDELLHENSKGLIALSGCVRGEIPRAIIDDDLSRAKKLILEYAKLYGQNNFFLEIQNHGLESEAKVRAALKKFSAELNVKLVATNDVHYVRRADSELHDILLCMHSYKKLDDKDRLKFPNDEYYLKSAEQMRELFFDTPEACDNTLKIAERCNITLRFGKNCIPVFYKDDKRPTDEIMREHCNAKIHDRYEVVTKEIQDRLDYELKTIHDLGYDNYFFIVQDIVESARKGNIIVGPGRGSSAGSLVSYVLGITDIDPLKYNLLFERFLNPERVTMPDIDLDLCYKRRGEILNYIREKYDWNKVSQIVTFGTLLTKSAIKVVAQVLNVPHEEEMRLSKMIPNVVNISVDEALEQSEELRGEYNSNANSKKIIDLARLLEGIPRNKSVHAAGLVISREPLENIVPLEKLLHEFRLNGFLITQYDKDDIEELGLLKMDFLGLRTLTIIEETLENIKKTRGIKLKVSEIPLRDKLTAEMLAAGKTGAVFQMESTGMAALVKELRPENFEEIIPTIALYRPGPLGSGMVEEFIAGKRGLKIPHYLHPKLEPILKETFGVILYQEQVMQIVQVMAGFTLGQADIMRRAMSKKNPEILLKQKENFLRGCESNGVEKSLAEEIFDLLSHFAGYGFNKSHSAAYGLLAWQTAYLKANYTAEFMAATLTNAADVQKLAGYIEFSRKIGIEILPPDINSSEEKFTVKDGAIHYGLLAIKKVNAETACEIVDARMFEDYVSPIDFFLRVNMKKFSRTGIENMIKCGVFDSLDNRRDKLLERMDSLITLGLKRTEERRGSGASLFGERKHRKKNSAVPYPITYSFKEMLAWENEALGFYLTGHPIDEFREKFSTLKKSKDLEQFAGKRVKVGGIIKQARRVLTKNGDSMAFIELEDFDGEIDVAIFPKVFCDAIHVVSPNEIVVVEGRVEFSKDTIQIIADKVTAAEFYVADFWLTVPKSLDLPATFNRLKKIFSAHEGNAQVFLNRGGKWQKLQQKISEYAFNELKKLLGADNIRRY